MESGGTFNSAKGSHSTASEAKSSPAEATTERSANSPGMKSPSVSAVDASDNIANLDEAEKCRDLGKKYLQCGEWAKSVRFFEKSLKLYPLPAVKAMLDRAKVNLEKSTSTFSTPKEPMAQNSAGGAARSSSGTSKEDAGASGRSFKPEEEQGAKEILSLGKKSHYKVLGIAKNATDSEIKKAYRKLSLKYHPDKSSAPSAENAFKTINAAYDVLKDKEKRNIYDQVGHENSDQAMNNAGNGGGFGGAGFHGSPFGAHGEINPEDIFNIFFNGGQFRQRGGRAQGFHNFGGNSQNARAQEHTHGEGETKTLTSQLFQFLPMLLLFLLLFSSSGSNTQSAPLFSMQPSSVYKYPQVTRLQEHAMPGIPFYVSDDLYSRSLREEDKIMLEKQVQHQYSTMLHSKCTQERNDNRFYSKKSNEKCEDLNKFKKRHADWKNQDW